MAMKGIKRVKQNIRAIVKDIDDKKTEAAIYAVLSQGLAISQTMIPIDTSNLINSAYAPQIMKTSEGATGTIGFTANYAGDVHERSGVLKGKPRADGNGNYWDPHGEPKFLTKGFDELKPDIPAILRNAYGKA